MIVIRFTQQPPAIDFNGPDRLKDRPDAAHLQCCGIEGTLHLDTSPHQFGADVFQKLRILFQRKNVGKLQANDAARAFAAGLHTGPAVANDGDVLAQFLQDSDVASLEAFAERRQDHNRDYAPDDSEHRQETADLVGLQVLPDLRQDDHGSWGITSSGNLRIVSTLYFL